MRTKETATQSTPSSAPRARSWISFSERAGMERSAPGMLIPLLLERTPPTSTSVRISGLRTSRTLSRMRPSSRRRICPGETSSGSPL